MRSRAPRPTRSAPTPTPARASSRSARPRRAWRTAPRSPATSRSSSRRATTTSTSRRTRTPTATVSAATPTRARTSTSTRPRRSPAATGRSSARPISTSRRCSTSTATTATPTRTAACSTTATARATATPTSAATSSGSRSSSCSASPTPCSRSTRAGRSRRSSTSSCATSSAPSTTRTTSARRSPARRSSSRTSTTTTAPRRTSAPTTCRASTTRARPTARSGATTASSSCSTRGTTCGSTNRSDRDLIVNLVDVVDGGNVTIDVEVDNIPGPTNSPGDNVSLDEDDAPGDTFEFDIDHTFPETQVEIQNLESSVAGSDIILDGRIENPIGRLYVNNVRGDILAGSDADIEAIRTNRLELSASGSIGTHETTRIALWIELIRYQNKAFEYRDFEATAVAGGDIVLDLTANRRTGETGEPLAVEIALLRAGDDVDVVVNDSKSGTDKGGVGQVRVRLSDPPIDSGDPYHDRTYETHFRPVDGDDEPGDAGLDAILVAFGDDTSELDSDYTFDRRARRRRHRRLPRHDDRRVRRAEGMRDDGAARQRLQRRDRRGRRHDRDDHGEHRRRLERRHSAGHGPADLRHHERLHHDHRARRRPARRAHPLDRRRRDAVLAAADPRRRRAADDRRHRREHHDDRRHARRPRRRRPADGLPRDQRRPQQRDAARRADRPRRRGELRRSASSSTSCSATMQVELVQTSADVSLRTVGGSIVDARNDVARRRGLQAAATRAADVIGRSIDIDANGAGASIGDPDGANDLDIDSSCAVTPACGSGDVALEATASIYLTETDATLRLVLAHASTGDIRLTVRETSAATTADTDEDLHLLAAGDARFAESTTRSPGNDPDAPRTIAARPDLRRGRLRPAARRRRRRHAPQLGDPRRRVDHDLRRRRRRRARSGDRPRRALRHAHRPARADRRRLRRHAPATRSGRARRRRRTPTARRSRRSSATPTSTSSSSATTAGSPAARRSATRATSSSAR